MKKTITPMSKVKFYLDSLKEITANNFTSIILHQHDSSTFNHGWNTQIKKGVKSDFIILFQDKSTLQSFGFSFAYFGLSEEEQNISYSFKSDRKKDDGEYSHPMSILEFKTNLKPILAKLQNNNETATVIQQLNNVFLKNKLNLDEEVDKISKTLLTKIAEEKEKLDIPTIKSRLNMAEAILKDSLIIIDKKITTSTEFIQIEALTKQISDLNKILFAKKSNLTQEYKITETKQNISTEKQLLSEAENYIQQFIDNETKIIPFAVKNKINKKL